MRTNHNFEDFEVSFDFSLTRSEEDVLVGVVAQIRKHFTIFNQWDRNVVEQAPGLELIDYEITPFCSLSESEKLDIEREILEAALSRPKL